MELYPFFHFSKVSFFQTRCRIYDLPFFARQGSFVLAFLLFFSSGKETDTWQLARILTNGLILFCAEIISICMPLTVFFPQQKFLLRSKNKLNASSRISLPFQIQIHCTYKNTFLLFTLCLLAFLQKLILIYPTTMHEYSCIQSRHFKWIRIQNLNETSIQP